MWMVIMFGMLHELVIKKKCASALYQAYLIGSARSVLIGYLYWGYHIFLILSSYNYKYVAFEQALNLNANITEYKNL